nr:putative mitochondrial protein [Tanacetum cinerariifolium]
QQVIQTPLQQKYVRKHMGFDFDIENKTAVLNLVADALSRVFEEDDEVTSAFMSFSRPVVGLLADLKHENETLDELCQIHWKIDQGETLDGFHREHGASGTQLNLSGAYHSQTDGQTKVINHGLEQYLHAMVLHQPQQWVAAIDELLVKRNVLLRQLKENLFAARNRMEMQANRSRQEVEFNVGDKATVKDYTKPLVTDETIEYVLEKYGKNCNFKDEIADVILEDLWLKYRKGKERIKKLKEDFGRMLKENEAKEAELKVNKYVVLFNDVKYPFTDAEIKMFKEKPATSRAPTRHVASTSTRSRAPTASTSTRSRAPSTRSRTLTASTSTFKASTRSRDPTAFASNAQAASTLALKGYRKIAMTGCVFGLRALGDPNAPLPSATRKRKSKK